MPSETLIFIDTNILLDYYRVRGNANRLALLDHLPVNLDRMICTSQVEMEYKKNRQSTIRGELSSIALAKLPVMPSFLESESQKSLAKRHASLKLQMEAVRKRLERALVDPQRYDRVYRIAQQLFHSVSSHNLSRSADDKEMREKIRATALKRFMLGYPPRKDRDTSIGDAINWEWMLVCAKAKKANLVIVSRDGDYGHESGDVSIINDWLREEYKDRVGQRLSVTLTARVAEAYKLAGISVTAKQVRDEKDSLQEIQISGTGQATLPALSSALTGSVENWNLIEVQRGLKNLEELRQIIQAKQNLFSTPNVFGKQKPET